MSEIKSIQIGSTTYDLRDDTKVVKSTTVTTKDQFYTKTAAGGQTLTDVAVKNSTGKDSVVNVTTDDGVSRTNTAGGAYSVAFGSRNIIGSSASESGAFGGDIHINSENTYGFGYHVWAHSNQNLLGGYDIGSNAKESLIYGNTIGIDCTHDSSAHTWTANSTADANKSKYLMVFGDHHSIASNCQSDLVYGSDNNIPQYVYRSAIGGNGNRIQGALDNSFVFGQGHYLGSNSSNWVNVFGYNNKIGLVSPTSDTDSYSGGNEDVNVLGYQNRVGAYLTDSTVIGYYNKIAGGSSSEKYESVYAIGYENTNQPSSTIYQRVFMLGAYLRAEADDRVIVGRYNDGTGIGGAFFEVGVGNSSTRRTGFAVCYNSSYGYHAYLGPTRLGGTSSGLTVNGTAVSLSGHTHSASDITSGTLGIARIPTGSSTSTSSSYVVKCNDSRLSDARPASDVSAWAKAASKPSYTLDEVTDGTTRKLSDYALATHNHDSTYLGKTATAADSSKLNGQSASYYQVALPTTTTAGKVLKSTSTAGSVTWGDDSNTNTWRNIKVDGTEKLSTGTGTGSLNFISQNTNNGDISFTYDSGIKATAKLPTFATVATSGLYSDLSGTPTIPTVNNSIITIKQTGISDQTFTLNGAAKTITLVDTNTWRPIGTGATDAAAGNHNHDSTYLKLAGGNMTGHIYLTGATSSSTSNTSQLVFGTSSSNHVAISSNDKVLIINPTTTTTTGQILLQVGSSPSIKVNGTTVSLNGHTHSYAGSSSAGGAATSANKLNTNAGSTIQPVYFSNGVPVATSFSLAKSVPSDAKFTDTTYVAATTSADGLMSSTDKTKLDSIAVSTGTTKSVTVGSNTLTFGSNAFNSTTIPTTYAGSSSAGGAATSAAKLTNTSKIGDTNKPVYFTANGVPAAISYTIGTNVPSNAVFTDTNYYHTPSYSSGLKIATGTGRNDLYVPTASTTTAGLMSSTDKTKLNGITVTNTSSTKSVTDGTSTLTFGSNAFTSTTIPTTYIKSASVSGNTLTLTKQDNTTVTFTPSGGGGSTLYRHNLEWVFKTGSSSSGYIYTHFYAYLITNSSTAYTYSTYFGSIATLFKKTVLCGGLYDYSSQEDYGYDGISTEWQPNYSKSGSLNGVYVRYMREGSSTWDTSTYITSSTTAYSFTDHVEPNCNLS